MINLKTVIGFLILIVGIWTGSLLMSYLPTDQGFASLLTGCLISGLGILIIYEAIEKVNHEK